MINVILRKYIYLGRKKAFFSCMYNLGSLNYGISQKKEV